MCFWHSDFLLNIAGYILLVLLILQLHLMVPMSDVYTQLYVRSCSRLIELPVLSYAFFKVAIVCFCVSNFVCFVFSDEPTHAYYHLNAVYVSDNF